MIVQEPISKLWITKGEISQLLDDGNSYLITTTDGQEIRRGLKLIRKLESPRASSLTDKQPELKKPAKFTNGSYFSYTGRKDYSSRKCERTKREARQ